MDSFPEAEELYPLKFIPLYQERIWGGDQLSSLPGRKLPENGKIGESWEISDRPDGCVKVASGPLAGRTLHELMAHYGRALVGSKAPDADRFPLLVKLIDAGDQLSLQVHPDAETAAAFGGGAEPKTEMWYVLSARPGAKILAGLHSRATRQQLISRLGDADVEELLQNHHSEPGDAYFITAGTIHAIGGGNLILEIQQNSDTTYRLSDWGRVDAQGKSRKLDIDKGLKSVHFLNRTSPRIAGVRGRGERNRKFEVITMCPYFRVDELHLASVWNDDTTPDGSFHLLSAINAPVAVARPGESRAFRADVGETLLVPAEFGAYEIRPESAAECTVVKTGL